MSYPTDELLLEHCFVFYWPLFSVLLGTHLTNTREAEAFALLSEEGTAKGIRRITAVTTNAAFDAIKLADSLEQEVTEASKAEESLLEKVLLCF